jgi:4-carboxymuconolactone decarboxylase
MARSELFEKGEAMRRKLRGDADYEANKKVYDSDPVMTEFINVATETVFGALWSRPGLDLKTRTLACVVPMPRLGDTRNSISICALR